MVRTLAKDKWTIGHEDFSCLDGSVITTWFIERLDGSMENYGGFESEIDAIEYLLKMVKESKNDK